MKKLVIISDLGHLKAFSYMPGSALQLLEAQDNLNAHGKQSDQFSDEAGRFSAPIGHGATKGCGEAHGIATEQEKRNVRAIASAIERLYATGEYKGIYLASPKAIHNLIADALDDDTRKHLEKNLAADLTKEKPTEIMKHFA